MPRVTEAHKLARRDAIMDAAQRVFARNGYRGTSITDIIRESGLSTGAIYSYFDGKDAIFHAVVERVLTTRTRAIEQDAGANPRSPGALIRDVVREMRGEPIMQIAPQIWAEAAAEPQIKDTLAQVFLSLRGTLAAELAAWARSQPEHAHHDPEAWAGRVALALASIMPGFILQRLTIPDFDDDAYFEALVAAFG